MFIFDLVCTLTLLPAQILFSLILQNFPSVQVGDGIFLLVISLVALWALVWKGIALWHVARHDKRKWWFILLFLVNTFGILEILYLFVFRSAKGESAPTVV